MKIKLLVLILLSFQTIQSQNYFEGKNLYCKSTSPKANELFNLGLETIRLNSSMDEKYFKIASNIFFKAYKEDTTFCDALFFVGYSLRLANDRKAFAFYIMADSLANNKSIEFKINLAYEGIRMGSDKSIAISRKTYLKLIEYFPQSPEGYYGFAITSPMIGDFEKGVVYLDTAIIKYKEQNSEIKPEVFFIKGVLSAMNKKYEQGLENLELSFSDYKKDENFKTYYSLCLLKVSELKNDEKMKAKAKKFYDKIENKDGILPETKELLKF